MRYWVAFCWIVLSSCRHCNIVHMNCWNWTTALTIYHTPTKTSCWAWSLGILHYQHLVQSNEQFRTPSWLPLQLLTQSIEYWCPQALLFVAGKVQLGGVEEVLSLFHRQLGCVFVCAVFGFFYLQGYGNWDGRLCISPICIPLSFTFPSLRTKEEWGPWSW